jgi:uncharacterized protein (DUF362 family)
VKVQNGNIDYTVEHAIELLGGMRATTQGKERILLKPNLVSPVPRATTKPAVVRTLARLMNGVHKESRSANDARPHHLSTFRV